MGVVSQHVERELPAYAERRLSAARRAQVEAHLASCAVCRAVADETVALVDALQAMPAALRGVPQGRQWNTIWAKVSAPSQPRLPRAAPRLSFYMGLMAVAFSAATLAPGAFGIRPAVTAGVVETPVGIAQAANIALTPRAATNEAVEALALLGQAAPVEATLNAAATLSGAVATPAGPPTAPTPRP